MARLLAWLDSLFDIFCPSPELELRRANRECRTYKEIP